MKRPCLLIVLVPVLSFPFAASAQSPTTTAPPDPGYPPGAAPAIPSELPPPPADNGAGPPPSEVPPAIPPAPPGMGGEAEAPTLDGRVGALESKVEGMDEGLSATRSLAERLNKLKFAGYIQGRYEHHADSLYGISSKPQSQFLVRRARLKATYDGTNAEYMLQIDAGGAAPVLKDAEATFVDTWSPFGFRLTLGQFKVPFGYEVLQSSGDREMPERATVIRVQFPGERDRGIRLQARYENFRLAAALVNGNFTQDSLYPAKDNNGFKDFSARLGGDFDVLVFGVSGYFGRLTTTTPASTSTAYAVSGTDSNMDGTIAPNELSVMATTTTKPASYRSYSVMRVGGDVQLYFDVPGLGGFAAKGELIFSKQKNRDPAALDASMMPVAARSCYDVTSLGWIVTVVQNIGDFVGAVVRIDSFDPNFSKSIDDSCPASFKNAALNDRINTYGGGFLLHASANLKGTFTYEHIAEQGAAVKNDVITAQFQAKF